MPPPLMLPSHLESIIYDMKQCIQAKLYYPALLVALTIPEICAALTLSRATFVNKTHYANFVDRYTTPPSLGLGGAECYMLRCGIVHRANLAAHTLLGVTHVVFTLPDSPGRLHAFSMVVGEYKSAMFDLQSFCDTMEAAARDWFRDHEHHTLVSENLKSLISYKPFGAPPFVTGIPVVASGP